MVFGDTKFRYRLVRAVTHLLLSLCVVGLIAALMLLVWYPEPYRSLSGGLHLLLILALVDVTLGPCATLVVSSPRKPVREWRMDMALIVLLQFAALGYGVWTVFQARPVYLAFEIDRFRTIHAVDVPKSLMSSAPPGYQSLPRMGPQLIAVRPFRDQQERIDATLAALGGVFLGARPDLWMPYDEATQAVLGRARPVQELLAKKLAHHEQILQAIADARLDQREVAYMPLAGRQDFWTVLLDTRTAEPVGFLGIDPYDP